MSKETFQVDILTPERRVLEIEATQVVVQTLDGSMGVLPKHIPLVSPLAAIWPIRIWPAKGKPFEVASVGGFIEVQPRKVSILAETAELPSEVDLNRAERARKRAEERLSKNKEDVDFARAEEALRRSLMRISVAKVNFPK